MTKLDGCTEGRPLPMEPEFAPEYSTRERWRLIGWYSLLMLAMVAASKLWLLPRFAWFAANSQCQTVFGIPGTTVLFYGLFVGLPLGAAVLVAAFTVGISVRAIRSRRYPPPGQKVLRRTRVRKGRHAIALALTPLLAVICLCALATWGATQAAQQLNRAPKSKLPPSSIQRHNTLCQQSNQAVG